VKHFYTILPGIFAWSQTHDTCKCEIISVGRKPQRFLKHRV